MVPDLAVEVISPGDSYSEVDEKVERYLNDGVRMVLVVDPQRRKVVVHVPNSNRPTHLTENDILSGGDVLPGFEVKVADIFRSIKAKKKK